MDVMKIPFVEKVGITRKAEGELVLSLRDEVMNHLDTVHAAAQFALAETASGDTLLGLFPDLEGDFVPLLRDSHLKFKRPACSDVKASAEVSEEAVARFRERLIRKGRASLTVEVEIRDIDDVVTSYGSFNWYVMEKTQEIVLPR